MGLQQDRESPKVTIEIEGLKSWKVQHPDLPFHDHLFEVNSLSSRESVQQLLTAIESISSQIFAQYTILIPPSFQKLLQPIKQLISPNSFDHVSFQFNSLYKQLQPDMNFLLFKQALRVFHSTGHIAFLSNGLVCSPAFIPKLISKFIDHYNTVPSECSRDCDKEFILQINSQNQRYMSHIANSTDVITP